MKIEISGQLNRFFQQEIIDESRFIDYFWTFSSKLLGTLLLTSHPQGQEL